MANKEKAVIFGAGKMARMLFSLLDYQYEIVCFVDNKEALWGQIFCNSLTDGRPLAIKSPGILAESGWEGIKVIITPGSWEEILEQLYGLGVRNAERLVWNMDYSGQIKFFNQILNSREVCCGYLFQDNSYCLRNLTFMPGGSGVLDYLLLRALIQRYGLRTYLEIGTYIGESIRAVSDLCEACYSITVPPEHPASMREWCQRRGVTDFSNRLVFDPNVRQFLADSSTFDYAQIGEPADLYFIDGCHEYSGVCADTKNVFAHKSRASFVVWHDFKASNGLWNVDVVQAVFDSIGAKEFQNIFAFDTNMCGVYVPDQYRDDWKGMCRGDHSELYSYELSIAVNKN